METAAEERTKISERKMHVNVDEIFLAAFIDLMPQKKYIVRLLAGRGEPLAIMTVDALRKRVLVSGGARSLILTRAVSAKITARAWLMPFANSYQHR